MDDKYYTVRELAELLGVKISTVYNWSHIGYVPTVKIGKLIRFKKESIDKWLKRQECKGRLEIECQSEFDST
jgi:excisionase family DNA binding protein